MKRIKIKMRTGGTPPEPTIADKIKSGFSSARGFMLGVDRDLQKKLGVPLHVRQYLHDLQGGEQPLTEKDLTDKELRTLRDIAYSRAEKDNLQYYDYKGTRPHEVDPATGAGADPKGFVKRALSASPEYALHTTLGRAVVDTTNPKQVRIKDQYNFNDALPKAEKEQLGLKGRLKGAWDALSDMNSFSMYDNVRNAARFLNSAEGEGSKVDINIGADYDLAKRRADKLIKSYSPLPKPLAQDNTRVMRPFGGSLSLVMNPDKLSMLQGVLSSLPAGEDYNTQSKYVQQQTDRTYKAGLATSGVADGLSQLGPEGQAAGFLLEAGAKADGQIQKATRDENGFQKGGFGNNLASGFGSTLNPVKRFSNAFSNLNNKDMTGIEKFASFVPYLDSFAGQGASDKAKRRFQDEQMRKSIQDGKNSLNDALNSGYSLTGTKEASLYRKFGGALPLSSKAVAFEGKSHEQGGIQLPGYNAEVEGGETMTVDSPYVFSEQLGFAQRHKPLEKQRGKAERRLALDPHNRFAKSTLEKRSGDIEALKLEQEQTKAQMGLQSTTTRRYGGSLKTLLANGGGPGDPIYKEVHPKAAYAPHYKGSYLRHAVTGNAGKYPEYNGDRMPTSKRGKALQQAIFEARQRGEDILNYDYMGDGKVRPYRTGYTRAEFAEAPKLNLAAPSGGIPQINVAPPPINPGRGTVTPGDPKAPKTGSNPDLIPYIDNVFNAFQRMPTVKDPVLERKQRANSVNFDAQRAEADRQMRGYMGAVSSGTSQSGTRGATLASLYGQTLAGKSNISQNESNINSQLGQQMNMQNMGVEMRNVNRLNDWQDKGVERKLASQARASANVANAVSDYQGIRRDDRLFDLENQKISMAMAPYKDSGVVDRNLATDVARYQEFYGGKPKKRFGGRVLKRFTY